MTHLEGENADLRKQLTETQRDMAGRRSIPDLGPEVWPQQQEEQEEAIQKDEESLVEESVQRSEGSTTRLDAPSTPKPNGSPGVGKGPVASSRPGTRATSNR